MNTLKAYDGTIVNVGLQVYRVKSISERLMHDSAHYHIGTLVRPISGVDDSTQPGYHFNRKYLTVCRVEADQAEFVGFPKRDLEYICNLDDDDALAQIVKAMLRNSEQPGQ